jgi:hypothetical protein
LLREGGSAARAAAIPIVFGGDFDLAPIEPMVLVKAPVLRSDYRMLEIERDLAERNEFVTFLIWPVSGVRL